MGNFGNMLFEDLPQPPEPLRSNWRKMIPNWAWETLRWDVRRILTRERQRNSPDKHIEIAIHNAHTLIRVEAFFPDCFLPDILKEAEGMIEGRLCDSCKTGTYFFNSYCGAFVCNKCGSHHNLAKCFCGWNVKSKEDIIELEG